MLSLSTFKPLVQSCLPNSRHHLSHFLFPHHAFIAQEFSRCACRNRDHADEDSCSNQVLKGLGSHVRLKLPVWGDGVQASRVPSSRPPYCNASCQYYHHQLEREPIGMSGPASETSRATSQMSPTRIQRSQREQTR